jgi:hypothetical protein
MTPDDLEPLPPDPSAMRALDDRMRSAAEGLRRATAVAPPPFRSQRLDLGPGVTTDERGPAPTLTGRRARKSRLIVALAAAAVIVVVVAVVVTRPTTSHRREIVPTAPAGSPTTVAPAGPTVTITPSTGLADGQVVHVVARGFIGGQYVAGECTAAVTFPIGNLGCDNGSVKPVTFDYMATLGAKTLTGSADLVVHKSFHAFGTLGDSGLIDCITDRTGCIILVWGGDPLRQNSKEEARAVLSFAP